MLPHWLQSFDLLTFLHKSSRRTLIMICASFVILVVGIDWASGPNLSTSIFYLLPISIAAWYINRRAGLAFSLVSAACWFITDYFTNPYLTIWLIPFWNAVVRFGFFLIVVFSLAALRRSRQRQEDLMAFVVHDLRAPLGNMLTAFDLLQMNGLEANGANDEVVKLGQSSGNRMMVLVDSLLDLSRLESGQVQLQREAIEVNELFEESIAQVILSADFKMITFEKLIDSEETAVFADRSVTQRVVVNLLNNALKFSPQGGVVTMRAMRTQDRNVTISVHDQGPGVPVEWQERIFAKYGQVAGGKSGGSGLGLTFCKLAVEAQDGRIWLESDGGSGTSLLFTLPIAKDKIKEHVAS